MSDTDLKSETVNQGAAVSEIYKRLSAPFDHTFSDNRGGVTLTYVTGEQAISRLNEELGVENWSFTVSEHGLHAEADECWVLGKITASINGNVVTREQFGSSKIKRSRSSGTPLDIGFDLKGAGTDALKKCASLLGVALYLSEKEPQVNSNFTPSNTGSQGPRNDGPAPAPSDDGGDVLYCEECGETLTETRFKDNSVWTPTTLASYGRKKHGKILDMKCYREHTQAKRRAEEAAQSVPF